MYTLLQYRGLHKRVPGEDLGNNRRPSPCIVMKGNKVGPGGWSVIMILCLPDIKRGGGKVANSPVVGGVTGHRLHLFPGPFRE